MKPPLLYIHGLGSDRNSRKFLSLKEYFKDEFEYDFLEWFNDSDIHQLIQKKNTELQNVEKLVIIGDSTGANFAYQLRDLRKSKQDILILTSPLLDIEKRVADFDFPKSIIPYLKKYNNPENAFIIVAFKDEVLNQNWLISSEMPKNLELSFEKDNHRLERFDDYLKDIRRYIYADKSAQTFWINDLTSSQIEKIIKLNEDLRKLELKIRDALIKIKNHKNQMLEDKLIDDFEVEIEVQLYSDNASTQIQFGNPKDEPFYISHFVTPFHLEDEEMFNINWSESKDHEYYICHLMHDLMYHSFLPLETLLTTNKIWIDFNVKYQNFIDVNG